MSTIIPVFQNNFYINDNACLKQIITLYGSATPTSSFATRPCDQSMKYFTIEPLLYGV